MIDNSRKLIELTYRMNDDQRVDIGCIHVLVLSFA